MIIPLPFDPLHDANHLMLVKNECDRRGASISVMRENDHHDYMMFTAKHATLLDHHEGDGGTENLAVLLAAKALEATA